MKCTTLDSTHSDNCLEYHEEGSTELSISRFGKKETMGGRFGKYGDTKRKARIRQSGPARSKGKKMKPDPKPLRRQKKKRPD